MKANFDGTKGEKKCKSPEERKGTWGSILVLWPFSALGLISSQAVSELHLSGYSIGKCLFVLSTGKTTGQTFLLIFPGSAFLRCAVSKSRNRQRWCFHWKSIHPTHIRSLLHGTQMDQFPVISHRITLHLPSRSTRLSSWRKWGPRWLGYTWMPTTACKTRKKRFVCAGDDNKDHLHRCI